MAEPSIRTQTITVKIRLRDKHAAGLRRQARAVNTVFNYCNETQKKAVQARRKWLSVFDLMRLTAGAGKELNLHAHTIQRVCRAYDDARKTQNKAWLRWRSRKSLGWVPFNTGHVVFNGKCFVFRGVRYEAMHLRDLLKPGMRFGAGSFNADARGHWYCNVPIETEGAEPKPENAVGIDLGLKRLATLSTGAKIEMPRFYRESERALATAQRARKTRRAQAIHAKARSLVRRGEPRLARPHANPPSSPPDRSPPRHCGQSRRDPFGRLSRNWGRVSRRSEGRGEGIRTGDRRAANDNLDD